MMERHDTKRGHSLLELLIAIAVLALAIGLPAMLLTSSGRAFGASTSSTGLDLTARRTLDRIAARLSASGLAGLEDPANPVPGVPLTGVTFRALMGLDAAGLPVWGPRERIEVQPMPGELLNGLDDDGNGLVDDGRIVWIPDLAQPGRFVVLCTGVSATPPGEIIGNGIDDNGNGLVDERGFAIVFNGERVQLLLALERRGSDGRIHQHEAARVVALRN